LSIEYADYSLISKVRSVNSNGDTCAILGDCTYHCTTPEIFASEMKFNKVDTFDVNGNSTYKIDLNENIPDKFHNSYDWLIDSGTMYCCFDIATVFKNITKMVKVGGFVLHTGNLSGFFGRGFYSLSPSLFIEFYEQNGFVVSAIGTRTKNNKNQWNIADNSKGGTYLSRASLEEMVFSSESQNFIPFIPNDSMICCLVRKKENMKFTKPIPRHFIQTNGR